VELVEDHRGGLAQVALSEHPEHHAGSGEDHLCARSGAMVVADAVAHRPAQSASIEL
jgi:hypothetical protein